MGSLIFASFLLGSGGHWSRWAKPIEHPSFEKQHLVSCLGIVVKLYVLLVRGEGPLERVRLVMGLEAAAQLDEGLPKLGRMCPDAGLVSYHVSVQSAQLILEVQHLIHLKQLQLLGEGPVVQRALQGVPPLAVTQHLLRRAVPFMPPGPAALGHEDVLAAYKGAAARPLGEPGDAAHDCFFRDISSRESREVHAIGLSLRLRRSWEGLGLGYMW